MAECYTIVWEVEQELQNNGLRSLVLKDFLVVFSVLSVLFKITLAYSWTYVSSRCVFKISDGYKTV